MNDLALKFSAVMYQNFFKPFLFRLEPEFVHEKMLTLGERLGRDKIAKSISHKLFYSSDIRLTQLINRINYPSPIGLAAGFDYEAKLTQFSADIGFGFQTIGTITNKPYKGNPQPRLGRLPKSKSLLVNKGFKNLGVHETIKKLSDLNFQIPIGISIGRTNSAELNQSESVSDIVEAFTAFETSTVKHSYYELNISCPNLLGNVTFYKPDNLRDLLVELEKLQIKRPIYVKMPIEKPNTDVLKMLEVISKFSPQGVIFGNLQKNRNHPDLVQAEVSKVASGNFSGKPTFIRSNELIALAYKHFKRRFTIVGCGGVFSAEDAYSKITLGASLVQLITGMVFQGPQLIGQINNGLVGLMRKDGVQNISELVGVANS